MNAKLSTSSGLVAVFDILGYKKMLMKNDALYVANQIISVFHRIPQNVEEERIELTLFNIVPEHLVFSDSILVYQRTKLPGISDDTMRKGFLNYCSRLTAVFLSEGLPVRGAIANGEFCIVDGKSFAGKCIVEAHEMAEALEFAGCVIVPECEGIFASTENSGLVFRWNAALKSRPPLELLMVDYSTHLQNKKKMSRLDLVECFGSFGKSLGIEVYPKIDNTLRLLRVCQEREIAIPK